MPKEQTFQAFKPVNPAGGAPGAFKQAAPTPKPAHKAPEGFAARKAQAEDAVIRESSPREAKPAPAVAPPMSFRPFATTSQTSAEPSRFAKHSLAKTAEPPQSAPPKPQPPQPQATAPSSPAAAPSGPAARNAFSLKGMEAVLLEMGVKPSHVQIAIRRAKETNESLDRIMRDFGFLSGEQVAEALSKLHNFDHFTAADVDTVDRKQLEGVKLTEYRRFVPVGRDSQGRLLVAVPDTGLVRDAGNAFFNERTRIVMASEQTILTVYRKYFSDTEAVFDKKVSEFMTSLNARRRDDDDSATTVVKDIYMALLRHACYSGASDVYLFRSGYVGVIKMKVNGVGQLFRTVDVALYDRLLNKLALENAKAEELRREPKETTISFSQEDAARYPDIVQRYGFRLELTESRGVKGAVFRILDRNSEATDLSRLGFEDETLKALQRIARTSNGLFLVTGPTGSGKTTTLYALLKSIDPVERSVQSIENPVEYDHGLWMQYELRRDAENEGEEYNKWLKALLRNAPDVILVGEVRDADVGNICMHAANTGHLVFATLHTNSASLALARLKALGLDLNLLSSLLLGVLGQRLVRLLCRHCKEPDNSRETADALGEKYLGKYARKAFQAGQGCANCEFTGFRGRRALYELLITNAEVRSAIEMNEPPSAIARKGLGSDSTIWGNGMKLVAQGLTSFEELQRVSTKEL